MKLFPRDIVKVIQRNIGAIGAFLLCGTLGFTGIASKVTREAYAAHDYKTALSIALGLGLMSLFGMYSSISLFVENWRSAFWIEVYDEKIVGYSFHKKRMWELSFDNIERIIKPNGFYPCFIALSMMVIDRNKKRYLIAIDVEKFGGLMILIKDKAVNAKKIEFGSWATNRFVWKK